MNDASVELLVKGIFCNHPYPYGGATKRLRKAVAALIVSDENFGNEEKWPNGFEYPDYGGLPKSISNHLTTDEVDYLQYLFNRV